MGAVGGVSVAEERQLRPGLQGGIFQLQEAAFYALLMAVGGKDGDTFPVNNPFIRVALLEIVAIPLHPAQGQNGVLPIDDIRIRCMVAQMDGCIGSFFLHCQTDIGAISVGIGEHKEFQKPSPFLISVHIV